MFDQNPAVGRPAASARPRTRLLAALVAAAVTIAAAGCGADAPDADEAKTPAGLIIGNWSRDSVDGHEWAWWRSSRVEFLADGTWVSRSNETWRVFRTEQTRGTYEVAGSTLRFTAPEASDDREREAAGIGPFAPLRLKTQESRIASVDADHLMLLIPMGNPDRPREFKFHRVR